MHVGYYQFHLSTPSSSGMYCLRVCIVQLHIYCTVFTVIALFMLISCCMSDLHAKLCPHCNVWLRLLSYKNYIVYRIIYMFV